MPVSFSLVAALLAPHALVMDQPAGGVSLLTVEGPAGTRCEIQRDGAPQPLGVPGTVAPPQGVASALACTLPGGGRWARAITVPPGVHRRIHLSVPPIRSADAQGWPVEVQAQLVEALAADPSSQARRARLRALDPELRPSVDQLDGVLAALPVPADRRWAAERLGPRLVDPTGAGRLTRHFAFAGDRAWWVQAQAAWAQRAE